MEAEAEGVGFVEFVFVLGEGAGAPGVVAGEAALEEVEVEGDEVPFGDGAGVAGAFEVALEAGVGGGGEEVSGVEGGGTDFIFDI